MPDYKIDVRGDKFQVVGPDGYTHGIFLDWAAAQQEIARLRKEDAILATALDLISRCVSVLSEMHDLERAGARLRLHHALDIVE